MEGWIVTGSIKDQRFGLLASNPVVGNDAAALISEFKERLARLAKEKEKSH